MYSIHYTTLQERNGKSCPSRVLTKTIPPLDLILIQIQFLFVRRVNWAACYVYVITIYILTVSLPTQCVRFTSVVHSLDHTLCTRDGKFRMLTSVVRPLYYTLRTCDVGRQAYFIPEDCLLLGLEGNVEGHILCT
jgi:hypothetical protein